MKPSAITPLPLAVGGLIALAVSIGIGRFIYTPILPAMVEALGLSKSEAGLIASANFAGYLAGALAAAMPWGKRNLRLSLLGFLALSGLTTAAMALASATLPFMLLRFLGGVASAYVLVLSSALVLERLAQAGAQHLSFVHFAGVGTGIAGSAVLVWGLSTAGGNWRAMWLWSGLASLISIAFVTRLVPPEAPRPPGAATPAEELPAMAPALYRLTLAYGLFGFGYVITATFLVAIVRASPEASPIEPAFWLIVGLVAAPSVWAWATVARHIGTVNAFAAACVLLAFGVVASVTSNSIASLAFAAVLLGGTLMGITALGLIAVRELAPEAPQRWIAIATSAFGAGQIVGPILAGAGYDLTGSFLLPSLLAAAALVTGAGLALSLNALTPPAP